MANEPLAQAIEPEAPSEDDYRAFCAALSESARGRAFLVEYARRQRAAETAMLMAAVERLEGLLVSHSAPSAPDDGVRQELLALLDGIREMQAEIDAGGLTMQVAKLASLIDVVQQRLEAIVKPMHTEAPVEETALTRHPEVAAEGGPRRATAEADHPSRLAPQGDGEIIEQAAAPEEIESVSDVAPPEPSIKSAAIPEVSWFDAAQPSAPPPAQGPAAALAIAAVIEAATSVAVSTKADEPKFTVFKAGTIPPPPPFAGEDFASAPRADIAPPPDPLAAITSLSEEERLALFT